LVTTGQRETTGKKKSEKAPLSFVHRGGERDRESVERGWGGRLEKLSGKLGIDKEAKGED